MPETNEIITYRDRLVKQMKKEGFEIPNLHNPEAYMFELVYMKGYMDALPDSDNKKKLASFLGVIYSAGRSITTIP